MADLDITMFKKMAATAEDAVEDELSDVLSDALSSHESDDERTR